MLNLKKFVKIFLKIPYFIKTGPIPPLRIMNELAIRGRYDAGMSGSAKWIPFELTEVDYVAVVKELKSRVAGLIEVAVPLEVKTFEDWCDWTLVRRVGEKGEELSGLLRKSRELNGKLSMLNCGENDDEIERLQYQLIEISQKITEIIFSSRNG